MSKIVDIQNALESLIETALPSYIKLSDSLDSKDNVNIHLDKGYSTAFGNGTNASDNFCVGDVRVKRNFSLVLTNVYNAGLDADYRQSLEQSLMDDHFKILAAIENNPTLDQACISVSYVSDFGIEYLMDENKQFIVIITNVLIDYIEGV